MTGEVSDSRGVSLPLFSRDRPKADDQHKFDFRSLQPSAMAEKTVSFNVRIIVALLVGATIFQLQGEE